MAPDFPKSSCAPLVLVVEDERDTRAVIVHSLAAKNYNILEAEDGQQAIEICKKQLPDLIVTDLMMPRVDGREFVAWFRKNFDKPFVPILILTALTQVEEKVEGLELGADDYLTKPFNFRELQARAAALLRIKRLTEMLSTKSEELLIANEELSTVQSVLLQKERQLVAAQLAGTAAHNLGQPITTILLNCRVLEKLTNSDVELGERLEGTIEAIQRECRVVKNILDRLTLVDPNATENYLGDTKILSLQDDS